MAFQLPELGALQIVVVGQIFHARELKGSGDENGSTGGAALVWESVSADDSEGRTWGLDGNLFWFVVGGVFAFVVTLLLLFSALRCSFWQSFTIASIPLAITLLYVFGFRQGKPPAYDRDLVDYWTNGAGFSPSPQTQPKHPLNENDHVAN